MIKPFLEISIMQTTEKEKSLKLEIIEKIKRAFKLLYKKESKILYLGNEPYLRIDFESERDFEKIYEKSFSFYVYIFENFLDNNHEFQAIFKDNLEKKEETIENYLVLRYKTNYIYPIKRYLGFTTRVNNIFGVKLINEELSDGYLRFINTKEDFETLLTPGDIREGWEEFFKIKKISLDLPQIREFFEEVEKWKKLY